MNSNKGLAGEKILLLTDVPPCKNYTGGLMTSQLIRFLLDEKKSVNCFCIKSKYVVPEYWEDINNDIEMNIIDRPEENVKEVNLPDYYRQIRKIKKSLIKYIRKNNITKIWCPIQGEVLINLLDSAYKKLHIPYVVQIWDPIEWWIKEHDFNAKRADKTLDEYKKVLMNSETCITTSLEMSKFYKKNYNIDCIEVMPGLEIKVNTALERQPKDIFTIALSGQIYAKEEIEEFLSALDSINWKYKGREIFFEHYGIWSDSYVNHEKHKKYYNRIIKKGFLPQNELIEKLSNADLLYCPYFFSKDEILKRVSKLSFPSKLITYLSVRVPILLHAPTYSSPYLFLKDRYAAYLMTSMKKEAIIEKIKNIMDVQNSEEMLNNAENLFKDNFTVEIMKKNFLKALNIEYMNIKKLNILEVNNVDLSGRRFNGFDLQEEINSNTIYRAKQIVTYKNSSDKNVVTFYKNNMQIAKEWELLNNESNLLSTHSQVSITSDILKESDYYRNADLVHYHLIHNTKISLSSMIELCNYKPSVWTIHDPWTFTGRCVYPQECEDWKTGCNNCRYLDNLFPLKQDNCNSLWKLKKKVYDKLDIDIIVTTPFMINMIKESPITKNFKNVHLVPFGLDLEKFDNSISKEEARKILNIPKDNIVLFFRAQLAMKGTEYIVEALKMLETDKEITLLSCSEKGLLEELKDKYHVIDLGDIQDEEMIVAYNACDIFLMPSRGESFGLMAIEAMACSRPIIVFNNSALPYVTFAPECGVLVENKDSYNLMKSIDFLIKNEDERIRRGKLGRKLAEQNYNIKDYNKRILEVYEKAYERQKNKKGFKINNYIDYSLEDVQVLLKKLNLIYRNLFPNEEVPFLISTNDTKYDILYKIDYSLESIQNLLLLFNNLVYKKVKDIKKTEDININIEALSKIKKIKYLYKYNRPELIYRIGKRVSKHILIYRFMRKIYRIIRKIKHIIFKNKYEKLVNRVQELEREIYIINKKINKE